MRKPSVNLRAGIIGLGVGEQHIEGYHRDPRCRVTVLCDSDAAKRTAAAAKYPGLRVVADAGELLDDPDVDVVSVASYDDAHANQIERALRNGKHVFAEKPLCMKQEEARRIRNLLAERHDLRLSSNLILRQSPRFQWLRAEVERGAMGDVFYAEADYDYGRVEKITEGWRGSLPFYSVFLGGGVHMVDLLRWLSGREVVEVTAFGNRMATKETGFRFNDFVAALLQFDGGLIGKVTANFGCVRPHFHRVHVYGTRATFVNDLPHARLYTSRDRDAEPALVKQDYPGYRKGDLILGFVQSILDGSVPPVTDTDVFRTLAVCFAVEQSMETGQPVRVDYLD